MKKLNFNEKSNVLSCVFCWLTHFIQSLLSRLWCSGLCLVQAKQRAAARSHSHAAAWQWLFAAVKTKLENTQNTDCDVTNNKQMKHILLGLTLRKAQLSSVYATLKGRFILNEISNQ